MERVCRQADGLFPKPADIKFSCSCPDSASMCKHVAAALYGAGARLDAEPDLLFRLRAVDAGQIFANLDAALPASRSGGAGTRLDASDLSDIFGIDMAASAPSPKPRTKASASESTSAKSSSPARISRSKGGGATTPAGPMKTAKAQELRAVAAKPGAHGSKKDRRGSPPVWRSRRSAAQAAREKEVMSQKRYVPYRKGPLSAGMPPPRQGAYANATQPSLRGQHVGRSVPEAPAQESQEGSERLKIFRFLADFGGHGGYRGLESASRFDSCELWR